MSNDLELLIMNLIVDAGNARSYAMEAIRYAKKDCIVKAEKALQEADAEISKAHHAQTGLIQNEAKGDHTEINLFMVHAQDHIMTAILAKDMAREIVEVYKELGKVRSRT